MKHLPNHLKKYVVEQNYDKYTSIDQACWRFILRQLRAFLSKHAHESYLEGLVKTGIEIESIPRISDISAKLEKFGWRALPVSGFIPPAAFMELQSLSVLPIASDMRTIEHLSYTPAPDIVHEAAGHAPILIHPEFADYLRAYAQVARKAIISKEDLDLYEAIRQLSDIKENPGSTPEEIKQAQDHLDKVSKNISHVSEAAELSRMNWWTAEYGLIGELNHPKIFGAGLLSSVGESKWCLSHNVKKIPLTLDCIKTSYDITEPQPQLFVTPDFKTLGTVLEQMAQQMAFRVGGLVGLEKAIKAETVNTVQLETGLQISGKLVSALTDKNNHPIYLKFEGPVQLCFQDKELTGHDAKYHKHGYSTPLGPFTGPTRVGETTTLQFESGLSVQGQLVEKNELLMTFKNCTVKYRDQILFDPSWGLFDMAVGHKVISVFAGPADRISFGETDDFVATRVPARTYSQSEHLLQHLYQQVRDLRTSKATGPALDEKLLEIFNQYETAFPNDWLLTLEILELVENRTKNALFKSKLLAKLNSLAEKNPVIRDGISLSTEL